MEGALDAGTQSAKPPGLLGGVYVALAPRYEVAQNGGAVQLDPLAVDRVLRLLALLR